MWLDNQIRDSRGEKELYDLSTKVEPRKEAKMYLAELGTFDTH
jgi:hypothetical protein